MTRAGSPLHWTKFLRLVSPLLLLACGGDSTGEAGSTAATSTGEAPGTTIIAAPTTGGDISTGTSSTGEPGTTGSDTGSSSGDTGALTGTSEPGSTGETPAPADLPPPVDPCADQDEPPPVVPPRDAINDDPAFIQVYVNNIENLKLAGEQCPGDWTDLIYYMKSVEPSPDLFLVQQISDMAQLDTLVERMNKDLPGIFEGVIADAEPWDQLSPCGKEKAKQTNAIVFRTGRFTKVGDEHVWQSWANKEGKCVRNNQARTRNVMVKLHDKIADKHVTVASMHWATSQGDGPDPACAEKNVLEVDQKLVKAAFGGDLLIFGGDFNEPDRKDNGDLRPWYAQANGDADGPLNYRDPRYRACQSAGGLQACLDDNWTIGGERRIDMLFGRDGDGCRARTARAHTITYNEAEAAADELAGSSDPDLNYSEHRGVRAEFYY